MRTSQAENCPHAVSMVPSSIDGRIPVTILQHENDYPFRCSPFGISGSFAWLRSGACEAPCTASIGVICDTPGVTGASRSREGVSGAAGVGPDDGGSTLRIRNNSSMHRKTAPETPSRTLNRSSMASRVRVSIMASCSSVKLGGIW